MSEQRTRMASRVILICLCITFPASVLNATTCESRLKRGRPTIQSQLAYYSLDLQTRRDLKIKKIILPLLDTTKTQFGKARLNWLLRHPYLDPQTINERLDAARTIAEEARFGKIDRFLDSVRSVFQRKTFFEEDWNTALNNETAEHFYTQILLAVIVRTPIFLAGVVAQAQGESPLVNLLATIGGGLTVCNIIAWDQERDRLEGNYRNLFEEISLIGKELSATDSPKLVELGNIFSRVDDAARSPKLAKLRKKLSAMLRMNTPLIAFRYLAELMTLHSHFSLHPVKKALVEAREEIWELVGAIAELDVYMALARYGRSSPLMEYGEALSQTTPQLVIRNGHHPYLLKKIESKSVPNTLDLGLAASGHDAVIVDGANKGGKSNYLRMATLATIFTQIGSPFPGKVWLTPVRAFTRMRIVDDEEKGESTFSNDVLRTCHLHAQAHDAQATPCLIVSDEMLRGTGARFSDAAEKVLIGDWSQTGNLILAASHNPKLAQLATQYPNVRISHVDYKLRNGKPIFTHQVLPGPAKAINAPDLLKDGGIPDGLIRQIRSEMEDDY